MSVLLSKMDEDVLSIMNPNFIYIEHSLGERDIQIFLENGLTEIPVLSTEGQLLDISYIFEYDNFR